ncbi:prepilin-type N-terminal cleavage/methylation domain-containing protein [Alteromonas ponticola]|uniref:Prepilin-type N-terminal cleavage/methylation domain-containing protein n=1 Tax=Alteromonas aquimaris TaxID=2998417 RepID=A0ABT3P4E4_9ALTE|nr:prepilin-type N-terminal cleavage/methylation domain-containing protein [Alteromonas aquimaris]MCW8107370.1 prepilin-type N-terminal cleavage/methylation domain-containing protein [Alteromonas aquimaris]
MLMRPYGFSLIELLITMALSLTLFTGVIALTSQLLSSQRLMSAELALKTELSLIAEILTNEIRRAGFNEHAVELFLAKAPSPFTPSVTLFASGDKKEANCILFSYDKNRNGIVDIDAPDERFGFKLHKNAIEIRRDGRTCEQGGWHDLTDPRTVSVTAFSLTEYFSPNGHHYIHILIGAHHVRFAQLANEKNIFIKIENG